MPRQRSPITAADAYRNWLFHGSGFRCVAELESLSRRGVVARLGPTDWHAQLLEKTWLIDPIILDSAPQLAIVWARAMRNTTALPSAFQAYTRFGLLSAPGMRCELEILPTTEDDLLRANAYFVNAEGRLVGRLHGFEATCARALNRLADRQAAAVTGAE
jgi:hypothetical protein